MARSVETELVDTNETDQSGLAAPHDKGISQKQGSESKTPSKKLSRWILLAAVIVGLAGATIWWLNTRNYESTDDAQIEGHMDLVSTRISGTVTYINPRVENNQFIKEGALLLELDPRDYQAELEHAKANLDTSIAEAHSARVTIPIVDASAFGQLQSAEAAKEQAVASVESEQANLIAAQHKLQQDEAIHARAERDRVRYLALVEKHEVSRSDYDARQTEAAADAQAVDSDHARITSEQQKVAEARGLVVEREAQIRAAGSAPQQVTDARAKSESAAGHLEQARADLHTAQLNLSYTKIYAPVSGVIGRKTVELGQRTQPGQSLLAIVPLDDIWITANFKETQLKYMRPGQPVTIRVDTFGRDYKGKVENLPGAAGPLFSLFPPENA
ncbi:MAG TPA: HlyD family secretion protein, partial [Bryobacteraceae bacterium]|nr:HlyD family secretion protein [Bryobacteraceae bacterium]